MRRLWLTIFCIGMLAGCNDKPKPKALTDINIVPMHTINLEEMDSVETITYEGQQHEFYVQHHVKGKDVYIECFIPGFSFVKPNTGQGGYIDLYVDGKKIDEITTAAFIVKGLSTGNHTIKIIVKTNQHGQQWDEQFGVSIQ